MAATAAMVARMGRAMEAEGVRVDIPGPGATQSQTATERQVLAALAGAPALAGTLAVEWVSSGKVQAEALLAASDFPAPVALERPMAAVAAVAVVTDPRAVPVPALSRILR